MASPSTPLGNHSVPVSAGNGAITPSAQLNLGVGDFTFTINPSTLLVNAASAPPSAISTNFADGYANTVNFACTGLSSLVTCQAGVTYLESPQTYLQINVTSPSLAAADYPFVVSGTAGNLTRTSNAVLQVINFTAHPDQTSAMLAAGKSSIFQVTLISQNHFINSGIQVFCQSTFAATCVANPATAKLADRGTTTVALTVTASASSTSAAVHGLRFCFCLWGGTEALVEGAAGGGSAKPCVGCERVCVGVLKGWGRIRWHWRGNRRWCYLAKRHHSGLRLSAGR